MLLYARLHNDGELLQAFCAEALEQINGSKAEA